MGQESDQTLKPTPDPRLESLRTSPSDVALSWPFHPEARTLSPLSAKSLTLRDHTRSAILRDPTLFFV